MTSAHPHKEIIDAWTADTSIEIERLYEGTWVKTTIGTVVECFWKDVRIKPKMRSITVDGVKYEWPEPMRVAPESGALFWYVHPITSIEASRWKDYHYDYNILKAGFAQATKEGAEAHRRALVAVSGGEL